MRFRATIVADLALLAVAAPADAARTRVRALPHSADGRLGEWRGTPANLTGRVQISRAELIYIDFLNDDTAPTATGPRTRRLLRPTRGHHRRRHYTF